MLNAEPETVLCFAQHVSIPWLLLSPVEHGLIAALAQGLCTSLYRNH